MEQKVASILGTKIDISFDPFPERNHRWQIPPSYEEILKHSSQ